MRKLSYAEAGPASRLNCSGLRRVLDLARLIEVLKGSYIAYGPRPVLLALACYVADKLSLPLFCSGHYAGCEPCRAGYGVYALCIPPPGSRPVFVAGVQGTRLRRFKLTRAVLASIGYGLYAVRKGTLRAFFKYTGSRVEEAPAPCPKQLLEALAETAGPAGMLDLKDAVDVAASTLSVPRGEARRLLMSLAERMCIVVENGQVVLLE